jgi:AraC-like DNA-binding protein
MLASRRIRTTNDMGDDFEDFEEIGVMSTEKRVVGSIFKPGYTEACLRRTAQAEAIATLRRLKWRNEKIALALGLSPRHVRRRFSLCREIAEAAGRV